MLIIGAKHSGKTLCARALNEIIGGEVVDLDELVEKQTGKTPRELFIEGQVFFKKAEVRSLASAIQGASPEATASEEAVVIATGGGIIDNDEAMALIAEAKLPSETKVASADRQLITVYLEISAETAWQRIMDGSNDGGLPPLIKTNNPKETHLALHNRRAKAYKAVAGITILAENKSPEEIAKEIADSLGHF
jgi:shikimate kinase